ncbi:caspase family protein, partial [Acinetobacter baumannii]
LAKVEPATSDTLVAFAAKAGSTADDGRGANSPFTTALLNHLTVPGRDVRIALGFVRDEVIKTTGSKQEPFVYGSLGGAT